MERRWKVSKKNYYQLNGEEKPQTMEESLKAFEDYENELEKSRPPSFDEIKKAFKESSDNRIKEEESKLRDHFAGLAMQGEITRCVSGYNFEETAKTAYMMADAMLKARKEVKP